MGAVSIDLVYDISPIVVTVTQCASSLLHFCVRLCAVVGGVFAVTTMVDKWVHRLVASNRWSAWQQ